MMKFAQLNQTLNFFLDDNPKTGARDYQFPLPLRVEGWNFAQDTFSVHTMAEKTVALNLPPGARSIALPADYGAMGLVYDTKNNQTYTQKELSAGVVRNDDVAQGFQYWAWGGQLFIDTDKASTLKLSYFAYWPSVEYTVNAEGTVALTKDDVLVPRWSVQALLHLTAAYCLTPHAIRAAMDRNFDIDIASGTPIMNSRSQQAREHAWWYDHLLSKFPAQVRMVGMND
jgi:hypothetical protein